MNIIGILKSVGLVSCWNFVLDASLCYVAVSLNGLGLIGKAWFGVNVKMFMGLFIA